jgi:AbrB family looped-hinge helix DNA binding protein
METHRARLIEGGKLIIPAPMRRSLGIATGDMVTIELDDGEIRIRTLGKALAPRPRHRPPACPRGAIARRAIDRRAQGGGGAWLRSSCSPAPRCWRC